jgi:hypothetical protein
MMPRRAFAVSPGGRGRRPQSTQEPGALVPYAIQEEHLDE